MFYFRLQILLFQDIIGQLYAVIIIKWMLRRHICEGHVNTTFSGKAEIHLIYRIFYNEIGFSVFFCL